MITNKGGILENRIVYRILSFIVNVVRSFPVIILIVFMLPVTKLIVGTSIGVAAAVVPLTVSATAFIAKLIESSLQEVDKELVEAMHSFGLSDAQVIFKVMFSEGFAIDAFRRHHRYYFYFIRYCCGRCGWCRRFGFSGDHLWLSELQ